MTKAAPPRQRKIAVMGFRSVGKSSLTLQFVEGKFVDSYDPTIENTFTKTVKFRSQDYLLKLIDTAGQGTLQNKSFLHTSHETAGVFLDEYSIVPSSYSMDTHGYILVYSITSVKSFNVIKVIYEKLLDLTGKGNSFFASMPIVLVGNKTDLHMERTVAYEDGKAVAESWNGAFLEASAKENQSVQEIFQTILLQIEKASGNLTESSKCVLS